jgi:hypothetical protein
VQNTSSELYCVRSGSNLCCIRSNCLDWACEPAHPCASEKGKRLVRREREAQWPPDWEVAGLPNGGATMLRPYEEEREQSGQPPSTAMRDWCFTHLSFSMARRTGGVGDKPGTLRRAYSGTGYHAPFLLAGAQGPLAGAVAGTSYALFAAGNGAGSSAENYTELIERKGDHEGF